MTEWSEARPLAVFRAIGVVLLFLGLSAAESSASAFQLPRDSGCAEWQDCRDRALAAASRGDFEAFHDLAWRAIQIGPPRNPALMFLLARAQSLSGRPHDALVMLERLAEMGIASDAATNEDFSRTRQLPGWPELQARIERVPRAGSAPAAVAPAARTAWPTAASAAASTASPVPPAGDRPVAPAPRAASPDATPAAVPPPASTASPATARAVASVPPPAASPAAPPTAARASAPAARSSAPPPAPAPTAPPYELAPASVEEALRFSTERFAVGGLAYDGVSHRFLLGDRFGHKVRVVNEGSSHAVDLVGRESAGFHEVSAIEIDAKRGVLWVASTAVAERTGALHRLQLVSGRPLSLFPVSTDLEPVTLVDLAVGSAGGVFVLDSTGGQLLALRSGATSLERVVRIDAQDPASIAVGDGEAIAYVAHRDGVARIDLRARTTTLIAAPKGVSLAGIERIRWYRRGLMAVGVDVDGARRIIHLELNAAGRAVTRVTLFETPVAVGDPTFVISGDDLVYLAPGSSTDAGRPSPDTSGPAEFVAYRVRLR